MHWSRPTSFSPSTHNTCQRIISTRRKMSHSMLHNRSSNSLPTNLSPRYQAFSARSRTHLKKLKSHLTIKKLSKMTTNSTLAQPRVTSWALSRQRRCTSMWQMSRRPLGRHISLAWPSSSQSYSRAMHNCSSTLISWWRWCRSWCPHTLKLINTRSTTYALLLNTNKTSNKYSRGCNTSSIWLKKPNQRPLTFANAYFSLNQT